MLLEMKRPEDLLNKAYASQVVTAENIECFSGNLAALFKYLQDGEREEHQKYHVRDFLNDTVKTALKYVLRMRLSG